MTESLNLFSHSEWLLIILMFTWSGFVRTGLGFGGVALGLPFMLLLRPDPLLWLPVLATHLLFFTFVTVIKRMSNVDWTYLWHSLKIMFIPKMIGVLGLVILPSVVLVVIVYGIILAFATSYIFNYKLSGKGRWSERFYLILGAYASGTSLVGAPLIVAAFSEHVAIRQLRDTLFVLWFVLVCVKMIALATLNVPLQWQLSLLLLPVAGIGHLLGLRAHEMLIRGDNVQFRRYLGIGMAVVSLLGLVNVFLK
jgi:hypothetical protein